MYTFKCKHEWMNMVEGKKSIGLRINTSPEARVRLKFSGEEELSVI